MLFFRDYKAKRRGNGTRSQTSIRLLTYFPRQMTEAEIQIISRAIGEAISHNTIVFLLPPAHKVRVQAQGHITQHVNNCLSLLLHVIY